MFARKAEEEKGNITTGCISQPSYMFSARALYGTPCLEKIGAAAAHRKFQQWAAVGVFHALWRKGLAEYDDMAGIAWLWEAADGSHIEAPLARESVGANPTDRGKKRQQKNILVDEHGVPLSFVVSGANRHDSVSLDSLLQARIVSPKQENQVQNLCLDAGYVGKEDVAFANKFIPHLRPKA